MKTIASVLLLISFTIYIGCDSSSSASDDATIQSLFPLKVGNEWNTLVSVYDPDGSKTSEDTLNISVDSAGTLAGHSGFYVTGPESIFFYYSGSDLVSQDPHYNDHRILLRYPLGTDAVLIHDTLYEDNYRSQELLKLTSKNVAVTVPAGTFSCYSFESISMYGINGALDTTSMSRIYLAKGIGFVEEDDYSLSGNNNYLRSSMKLLSYTLK